MDNKKPNAAHEALPRVGFIGLGLMGRPMALQIISAGFSLTVNSRSPGPVASLASSGASQAATPRDEAANSDVLVVMVPETADLIEVVDDDNGILAGSHEDLVVCDTGTHSPWEMPEIARRLEAAGAAFLDAPVSGGEIGARDGTLAIMVGGSADAFERASPVLRALGSEIVHVGPVGAGQLAKACHQLVVAATIQAVAESLVLATAAGIDSSRVRDVMLGDFASSRVLEVHGRRTLDGNFEPGACTSLHAKDAEIVLESAKRLGLQLPGFAPVAAALRHLVDAGHGDLDHSALVTLLGDASRMPWNSTRNPAGTLQRDARVERAAVSDSRPFDSTALFVHRRLAGGIRRAQPAEPSGQHPL